MPFLSMFTPLSLSETGSSRWYRLPRQLLGALACAVPMVACSQNTGQVYESAHHDFRLVTVAEGLVNPWSMAFLPNGDMLLTEKAGRLRLISNGELLDEPVAGVPAVRDAGQGGLLDVALHPDFENNRYVYLSYSKPRAGGSEGTTAVIRGRLEGYSLVGVEEIFEAVAWTPGNGHFGSRLVFDQEGYLFITVGDRQAPPQGDLYAHPSQDLSNHHGVTVRLHDDGSVPDDNPFVGRSDALPSIWSYGHRNAQGMALDPRTGLLWQNEHGAQGGDELNVIQPGRNYGWPVIGYGVNYGNRGEIHEDTHQEGMEQPAHYWLPSIATSGLMVYTGNRFSAWQGSIFTGGMSAQHQVLSRVTAEGAQVTGEELLMPGELRLRDIRQGPDGYIYLAVDHRGGNPTPILRMEPADASD